VGDPNAQSVGEKIPVDARTGAVAGVLQRAGQTGQPDRVHPDLEAELGVAVSIVAQPDAFDAHRTPVAVHLPVEDAAVLELRAQVRLGHAPSQIQIPAAGPLGVVGDPGLGGRAAHQRERAEHGFTDQLAVGTHAVGAERMEQIAADMAVGLDPDASAHEPAL
jgi:hypothetical protein